MSVAAVEGDDAPTPAVAQARRHLKVIGGHVRATTIPAGKLTKEEWVEAGEAGYPEGMQRPKTRGDCIDGPRPCPWAGCSMNLYLDVHPQSGAIKLNFPHLEPGDLAESCALDVADRGGMTLEEIGRLFSITRERIRQLETFGLRKMALAKSLGLPPERQDISSARKPNPGCP